MYANLNSTSDLLRSECTKLSYDKCAAESAPLVVEGACENGEDTQAIMNALTQRE